jgi:aryl-alcohol dehydrogenase-like predicted oxidoreductase
MLGQSFKNLGINRKDVVIATKCYGRMGPGHKARSAISAVRTGPHGDCREHWTYQNSKISRASTLCKPIIQSPVANSSVS